MGLSQEQEREWREKVMARRNIRVRHRRSRSSSRPPTSPPRPPSSILRKPAQILPPLPDAKKDDAKDDKGHASTKTSDVGSNKNVAGTIKNDVAPKVVLKCEKCGQRIKDGKNS